MNHGNRIVCTYLWQELHSIISLLRNSDTFLTFPAKWIWLNHSKFVPVCILRLARSLDRSQCNVSHTPPKTRVTSSATFFAPSLNGWVQLRSGPLPPKLHFDLYASGFPVVPYHSSLSPSLRKHTKKKLFVVPLPVSTRNSHSHSHKQSHIKAKQSKTRSKLTHLITYLSSKKSGHQQKYCPNVLTDLNHLLGQFCSSKHQTVRHQ